MGRLGLAMRPPPGGGAVEGEIPGAVDREAVGDVGHQQPVAHVHQRLQVTPVHQVARPRAGDAGARSVLPAVGQARSHQHLVAAEVLAPGDMRVAPPDVPVGWRARVALAVIGRCGAHQRVGGVLVPGDEVVGENRAQALNPAFGGAVEHPEPAVVAKQRPGQSDPGLPTPGDLLDLDGGTALPVHQVAGHGVPQTGPAVGERAVRRLGKRVLEVDQVILALPREDPAVPQTQRSRRQVVHS